jgi:WD40 repeat protein
MVEAAQPIITITTPNRRFKGHELSVTAVAIFPDGCRMVTGSQDKTLSLWDLKDGVVLKKMEGHSSTVWAIAISRDGRLIASGDENGGFVVWRGATGECLTQAIRAHSRRTRSLDFSPDGEVLAVGSWDKTTKVWNTKTWEVQENTISCRADVNCVRFSPSGELLAIATNIHIQIWNPRTSECIAKFKTAISKANNLSLAWTPDGTRLLSAGSRSDPTIREWDTSTWQQVGDPWSGHLHYINTIAVNSAGTLAASSSSDKHVRLWRLSDRRTIAIFECSRSPSCVTFSTDGKYIFTGSHDTKVLEWAIPEVTLLDAPKEEVSEVSSYSFPTRHHLICCLEQHT